MKNPKNLKAVTLAVTASQDGVSRRKIEKIQKKYKNTKNVNFNQISGGRGSNPASCALFLFVICSNRKKIGGKSQTFVIFDVQAHMLKFAILVMQLLQRLCGVCSW